MLSRFFKLGRNSRRTPVRSSAVPQAFRPKSWRPQVKQLEARLAPTVAMSIIGRVLTAQCDSGVNTVTVDHASGPPFGDIAIINGTIWSDANYDSIRINGGTGGTTENIHFNVKPLLVVNSHDFDTVNVGDTSNRVQSILGTLDIENVFWNVVNINDQGDTTNRTVVVQTVGHGQYEQVAFSGSAVMNIRGSEARAVNIKTGGHEGTSVAVYSTYPLHGPRGTATALIGNSITSVTLGLNHSVGGIQGEVSISNPLSFSSVVVDDAADNMFRPNAFVSAFGVSGLGSALITYQQTDLSGLTVELGTGGANVNVLSTPFNTLAQPKTTLTPHAANTTFTVGNAGLVAGIAGALDIGGPTAVSGGTVTVDDSADGTFRSVSIGGVVSGLAADMGFHANAVSAVNISTGTGGALVHVTRLYIPTTLIAHSAGTVFVDSIHLPGTLNVYPAVSGTFLVLNDANETSSRNVILSATSVAAVAGTLVNFHPADISSVTINGYPDHFWHDYQVIGLVAATTINFGHHPILTEGDAVNVSASTGTLTINTGNDYGGITLGSVSQTLDSIQGPVIINDYFQRSRVLVDDSGFFGSDSYTITGNNVSVGRVGGFSLTYDGGSTPYQLNLKTGPGNDTINIESTTYVPTVVNAGTGGNVFRVSPTDQYLADIAAPLSLTGGGSDVLEFFDTANPNNEMYTFDSLPSYLTLATLPGFAANWTGMGSVYLETNGVSMVTDQSQTVFVDVPPPTPPNSSPAWNTLSAPVGGEPAAAKSPVSTSNQATAPLDAPVPSEGSAGHPVWSRSGKAPDAVEALDDWFALWAETV